MIKNLIQGFPSKIFMPTFLKLKINPCNRLALRRVKKKKKEIHSQVHKGRRCFIIDCLELIFIYEITIEEIFWVQLEARVLID